MKAVIMAGGEGKRLKSVTGVYRVYAPPPLYLAPTWSSQCGRGSARKVTSSRG